MIITKEQQEALVYKYMKEKHTQDECVGFIDGLNAMLGLVCRAASKIDSCEDFKNKQQKEEMI